MPRKIPENLRKIYTPPVSVLNSTERILKTFRSRYKLNKSQAIDLVAHIAFEASGAVVKSVLKKIEALEKERTESIEKNRKTVWANDHQKCKGCGTKESPHVADGFCRKCFDANRNKKAK